MVLLIAYRTWTEIKTRGTFCKTTVFFWESRWVRRKDTGKFLFILKITSHHDFIFEFKGALSSLRQLFTTESALKMMKNAFYFTSKALCVLKIFKLLSWLFGHVARRLDKKDKVDLKFYDVIVIHILSNIMRSKGNQTMKLGQLTDCNTRNNFLEKSYTKYSGETSPRPFSE